MTNRYTKDYFMNYGENNKPYEWNGAYEKYCEKFKVLFNPKKVLDVSCATGLYLKGWKMVGVEAEGCDISKWAIDNPVELGLKTQVADITKPLPYADNSFDLVMCFDTLEHLEKEQLPIVMKELRRISSNRVVLTTVFKGMPGHAVKWAGDVTHKIWEDKGWWLEALDCDHYGYFILPYEITYEDRMGLTPLLDQLIVTGVEE